MMIKIRIMLLLFTFVVAVSCQPGRNRDLAGRVYELEAPLPEAGELQMEDTREIQEIKKDIKRWEKELNHAITAARNTGRYYRILGLKYLDFRMYAPARDSFGKALEYSPENGRLYYYRGLAAGRLAGQRDDEERQKREFHQTEKDYIKAITLEPRFMPPHYALAILYIYELERPFEAAPYLEKYLEVERSNGRALLVYGQLLEQMGKPEGAMAQYNKILALTAHEKEKNQARLYLKRIKEGAF